jgi:endoglucanase
LWFVDRQTPSGAKRQERMAALNYAIDTLAARNPNVRTYLEAGTTSESVTPERMAELLIEAGASDRTGFAVNVSSFAPEPNITDYAREVRGHLIDQHGLNDPRWVVDTSRNGNAEWDFTWCNPADREIGVEPGPVGSADGRDANLWIKGPATSDGDCGIGRGTVGGDFLAEDAARQLR